MHHFNHHIGDYAEATSHLSILEDGVYSRLLRKYYARERPLPADVAEVQRLCVARSKAEKAAVVRILAEFFTLEDDGYHQDRCDDTIAEYQEGEPDRELSKANKSTRSKRHRDHRAQLFETLRDAGIFLPYNAPINDVRAAVAACTTSAPAGGPPGTPPVTLPATPETSQVTAPGTPVTANHEPVIGNHEPDSSLSAGAPPETPPTPGEICKAMRFEAELTGTNPSNVTFLALLASGITRDEFVATAQEFPGKSFAYVLAVIEGRRADAAKPPAPRAQRRATSHTDVDNQQFSEGMDANGTLA